MKKLSLLFLSLLLTVSLVGCQSKDPKEEQVAFDKFINESYIEDIQDDYLSVHLNFEHPEKYGIDKSKVKVNLGERMDTDNFDELVSELKEKQKAFKEFDKELLTDEQQDTYDIYQSQLETSERSLKKEFQYIGSAFEDGNGLQVQLTYIFEHFPLREEQDVKDLITLLKDVLPYVESALSYTKKQVENGNFMTNITNVNEFCQKIVDKGMKSSLLKTMRENVSSLDIDNAKKTEYLNQLDAAFKNSFIAGYQSIIDTLNSLKSAQNNKQGLSYLKNGKEYYEALVQSTIGEGSSIKDVKKQLENTSGKYYREIMSISLKNPNAYDKLANGEIKTKYNDYKTMLKDLEAGIGNKFPKINEMNYTIQDIDPEVVSGSVGAYFFNPPIEQTSPMQIRVNNSLKNMTISNPDTFTTVAHEGIPGHMYQASYVRQHFANNPYRVFVNCNGAYSEGYAKYVEMLAYNYIGADEDTINLLIANQVYTSIQILIADIGIHYEGWDIKEFKEYLTGAGLSLDDEGAQGQYDQLQANSGMFMSYFYGFSRFDSLREEAENKLGDKFDEVKFHDAILKSGVAPFSVVERNVEKYINEK